MESSRSQRPRDPEGFLWWKNCCCLPLTAIDYDTSGTDFKNHSHRQQQQASARLCPCCPSVIEPILNVVYYWSYITLMKNLEGASHLVPCISPKSTKEDDRGHMRMWETPSVKYTRLHAGKLRNHKVIPITFLSSRFYVTTEVRKDCSMHLETCLGCQGSKVL